MDRLRNLDSKKQLVFCIVIAKRLIPNYDFFHRREGFGSPASLRDIIELGLAYLEKKEISLEKLSKHMAEIKSLAPDSEEYSSIHSTFAIDAVAACYDILSLLESEDLNAALRTSGLAINSVDISVLDRLSADSSIEDPEFLISSSEEMKNEIQFQKSLLDRINSLSLEEVVVIASDAPYKSNITL